MRITRIHLIPSPEAQAAGEISYGIQCNNTALGNFAKVAMFIRHVGEMIPCGDIWLLADVIKSLDKVLDKLQAKVKPGVYSGGVIAYAEYSFKIEVEVAS